MKDFLVPAPKTIAELINPGIIKRLTMEKRGQGDGKHYKAFLTVSSLEKQKSLVAIIEALKSKIHGTEEVLLSKIGDLQSLKAPILDSAFKGEL